MRRVMRDVEGLLKEATGLCLRKVALHVNVRGQAGTSPEDSPIAIFFHPPKCSEDNPATFKIFVNGWLPDVDYTIVVQVQSPENMIHEERSALEGAFIHRTVPPLPWASYGTYTIRVSIFDSIWSLLNAVPAPGGERFLGTMMRPLELRLLECSDLIGVILRWKVIPGSPGDDGGSLCFLSQPWVPVG